MSFNNSLDLYYAKKKLRSELTAVEKTRLASIWCQTESKALHYNPEHELTEEEELELYELYVELIKLRRGYSRANYPRICFIKPIRLGGRWCAENARVLAADDALSHSWQFAGIRTPQTGE